MTREESGRALAGAAAEDQEFAINVMVTDLAGLAAHHLVPTASPEPEAGL